MELWMKFLFFFINVFVLAALIAIVEIWIEKDKGWYSGHPKDRWYTRKVCENHLISRIVGVPYFSVSNILIGLILLLLLLAEYFFVFPHALFLVSVFLGGLVVEDFLWFFFNWYFPALRELLKGPHGSIWWHRKWLKISSRHYLPRAYLAIFIAILLIFIA